MRKREEKEEKYVCLLFPSSSSSVHSLLELVGDEKKVFFLVHLMYCSYVFFGQDRKDYTVLIHSLTIALPKVS